MSPYRGRVVSGYPAFLCAQRSDKTSGGSPQGDVRPEIPCQATAKSCSSSCVSGSLSSDQSIPCRWTPLPSLVKHLLCQILRWKEWQVQAPSLTDHFRKAAEHPLPDALRFP